MFNRNFLFFTLFIFNSLALFCKKTEAIDSSKLLTDFYPCAAKLCEKEFMEMSAEKLENVYSEIIKTFDEKRWSYFCDSKSEFSGKYLDKIISEIERYIKFLESFKIDFQTGCATTEPSRMCSLKDFWHHKLGKNSYYRFHAIYLDYLIMKMYSYPMRMIVNREDLYKVSYIGRKISSSISKLASSKFENYYQKALERAFRIVKLLENRVKKNLQDDLGWDCE
jgi:hypothetical protein